GADAALVDGAIRCPLRRVPHRASSAHHPRRRRVSTALLALDESRRGRSPPDVRPGAHDLRLSPAALPVRGPRELLPGFLGPALLELAVAHGLLRRRVRSRGPSGRPRDGARPPPTLPGPAPHARAPPDSLGPVPRGGWHPVAGPPRRRLRRPERRASSPGNHRPLHRLLRE